MSNLKKLVLISALSISFPVAGWSQSTPLLKSTDYLPLRVKQHRKFSFKRLVKHICLAPVSVLTACGNPYGYCGYPGYYPAFNSLPPNHYYGYDFGMNSSPFGYNYVY